MRAVVVSQRLMIAQSLRLGMNNTEVGYDDVLVKESDAGGNASSPNVWDEEW